MAQIINFTNCAPAAVQQKRGPGRHPKNVLPMWRARNAKVQAAISTPSVTQGIEEARNFLRAAESILFEAKHQMLIAKRRAEGKQL